MRAFCDICRVELWAFPGVCEQCVRSGLGFDVGFYLARDEEVIMGAWVLLALLMGAANLTRHKHIGDTTTLSRLRQDGWLGAALLALVLTGCAAGDLAVGVAVVDRVTEEVTHEHAHNCMCVPDGRTKQWYWCDENGKRDGKGEYACCFFCEKNCGRLRDDLTKGAGK